VSEQIVIVAGEVSGDIHAGNLLESLKTLRPGVEAFGIGGERLERAGLECLAHSHQLAHMGLVEVVRELPEIRRIMLRLAAAAELRRPALAVLVDSPDFNLRLAARLRRLRVPVVLYVSPQLWAWRRGRVRVVRRLAREVICLLPFEPEFYHRHGVAARYVGHPLVDDVARDGLEVSTAPPPPPARLALLPGSRAMEVRQLLPVMLRALAELEPDEVADAVLVEAPGVAATIDSVVTTAGADPRLRRVAGEGRRTALAGSMVAWTASGTATLECALLGVPMVVGYRLQALSYLVARLLVHVPHVGLVNLIADARVAPELLQRSWSPVALTAATRDILADRGVRQRRALAVVRERLGAPGASLRAAGAICEHLDRGVQ
jgi:lipid-A-disaccharide synthase